MSTVLDMYITSFLNMSFERISESNFTMIDDQLSKATFIANLIKLTRDRVLFARLAEIEHNVKSYSKNIHSYVLSFLDVYQKSLEKLICSPGTTFVYSFLLPDNSQAFVAEANIQIFRHQVLGNRTVLNKSVATLLIYQAAYQADGAPPVISPDP